MTMGTGAAIPERPAVLVIGVGYVGSLLCGHLVSTGHTVLGLTRTERALPAGVHPLRGDASDAVHLLSLGMRPAQVVLAISPGARTKAAYERSYLAATRSLVSVFPDSRLILVSSTAVYGEQSGEEITDETPKHPQTETARVLSEAEDLALGLGHTVVRASGIYGPTRTRLLRRLCRGDVDESEADTWTNRIHRDDLSRVLSFLVTRPELRGSFIASDTEPAQLAAMMAWARGELGLEKINPRPAPLAAKEATRKSRRILPTRLLSLGFEFRYRSYREGYRELLAEVADSTEHD